MLQRAFVMRKEFVRRRLHHVLDQRYMGEKGKVGVRLPLLLVWLLMMMRRRSVRMVSATCARRRSEAGQEVEVQLVGTRADVRCQTMRASSSLLCLIVYMLFSSRTSSSYLTRSVHASCGGRQVTGKTGMEAHQPPSNRYIPPTYLGKVDVTLSS